MGYSLAFHRGTASVRIWPIKRRVQNFYKFQLVSTSCKPEVHEVFLLQTLSHPYIVAYRDSFLIEGASASLSAALRKEHSLPHRPAAGEHFGDCDGVTVSGGCCHSDTRNCHVLQVLRRRRCSQSYQGSFSVPAGRARCRSATAGQSKGRCPLFGGVRVSVHDAVSRACEARCPERQIMTWFVQLCLALQYSRPQRLVYGMRVAVRRKCACQVHPFREGIASRLENFQHLLDRRSPKPVLSPVGLGASEPKSSDSVSVRWLGHQARRLWHLTCAGRHHRGKFKNIHLFPGGAVRLLSAGRCHYCRNVVLREMHSSEEMHRFLSVTDLGHTTCLPKFVEASRITGNPTSGLSPRLEWPP